MAIDIEQLRADMEAGTPGSWAVKYDAGETHIIAAGDSIMCDMIHYRWVPEKMADWRRIARLPDLEAAFLAAQDMATVMEEYSKVTDWFPKKAYDALKAYRKATNGDAE